MRVVVTGATGNVGTALLEALAGDDRVTAIAGLARRLPDRRVPRVAWHPLDVSHDDLEPVMRGADAVVHLAWAIQPSRDMGALWRTNVLGSSRVFESAAAAGVPALIHASSVGVYSPGPKDRAVDERWPRRGTPTSFYALHKAEVERRLDILERGTPGMRVVRMRPGLTFSRRAASGIARLFLGPLVPRSPARPSRIPLVPDIAALRVQAVHSDDVADAYRRALLSAAAGAFNVAADPVLDAHVIASALRVRRLPVAPGLARALVAATWRARLQVTPPVWLDMALAVPLMDTTRARVELGWAPRRTAVDALMELLRGLADGAGADTPPLRPSTPRRRALELPPALGLRRAR